MAFSVDCPSCGEPLDVDEGYRTWKVRCPHCRHEFYPTGAPTETDDNEPRSRPRRRSRREPLDDETIIERAKTIIGGPASWLRVTGILGVLAGIAGIVGAIALGVWVAENPAQAKRDLNVQNEEELIINVVAVGISSVLSVVVGGLMAFGAVKMARLESQGWATASAVMAIGSVLFCTCCLVSGVPLGIWALVTLNNPAVQAGFNAMRKRTRAAESWEHSEPDDDQE